MLTPPTPFYLRPLTMNDIAGVLAIDKRSFPTAAKEALYEYELTQNRLSHYQGLLRSEPASKEALLGYAGYWVLSDEIHVSTIAVDPAFRRQGLGQLLLLNILFRSYVHEARLVTLEVREENQAARALYEKYRFSEVGLRHGYYRDTGENAVLMTVSLETVPDYQTFLEEQRDRLYQRLAQLTP